MVRYSREHDQTVVSVTSPEERWTTVRPATSGADEAPVTWYGRLLLLRAAVAVTVGVSLWALLGRWAGVVGALFVVIVALAEAVYRSKTRSRVPAWRKPGSPGRRTERQLRRLESKGYRTLHARAVPDSTATIDHLVVGPTGVFAVGSEKWGRDLAVRAFPNRLFVGPFSRDERLRKARWEAESVQRLLSARLGYPVEVVPCLAIYGPTVPWKVLRVRAVDVFAGSRVRTSIRRRSRTLHPIDAERIADAAEAALPFNTDVKTPD